MRKLLIFFFTVCAINVFAQSAAIPRDTFLARKYVIYNGGGYDSGTLNYLVNSIGTTKYATIMLDSGRWAVTNDLTIPTNVGLYFASGSYLDASDTNFTLTILTCESDAHWTNEVFRHTIHADTGYFTNLVVGSITYGTVFYDSQTNNTLVVTGLLHATEGTFDALTVSNLIADSIAADGATVDVFEATNGLFEDLITDTFVANDMTGYLHDSVVSNIAWLGQSPIFTSYVGTVAMTNNGSVNFVATGDLNIDVVDNTITFSLSPFATNAALENYWAYVIPLQDSGTNGGMIVTNVVPDFYWDNGHRRAFAFGYMRAVLVGHGGNGAMGGDENAVIGVPYGGGGGGGGGFVEIKDYPLTNGAIVVSGISATSSWLSVNGDFIAYATCGHSTITNIGGGGGTGIFVNVLYGDDNSTASGGDGGDGGDVFITEVCSHGGGGGACGWFFGDGGDGGDGNDYSAYGGGGGGAVNGFNGGGKTASINYMWGYGGGTARAGTNNIFGLGASNILITLRRGSFGIASGLDIDAYTAIAKGNPLYADWLMQAAVRTSTNSIWDLPTMFTGSGAPYRTANVSDNSDFPDMGGGGGGGTNHINGGRAFGGGGGGGGGGAFGGPSFATDAGDGGSAFYFGGGGGGGGGVISGVARAGAGGNGGYGAVILYFR